MIYHFNMRYYDDKLKLRWRDILQRCHNPNHHAYKYYGGRGIKVCDRWLAYSNFNADLRESFEDFLSVYGSRNTTLDRINNEKGYFLENIRWATMKTQANNRRNNIPKKDKERVENSKLERLKRALEIQNLYEQRYSMQEIGLKYKISRQRVYQLLKWIKRKV